MISENIQRRLSLELERKCRKAKIPGMALIANLHGERIFEKFYGYRDLEKRLPVTADTVFGVASITKSFASLAIMQLEDMGKLSVNDFVKKWIPEFELPGGVRSDHVTIHHLLTHTSGLPGLAAVHQARAESIKRDPDGEYLFGNLPTRSIRTVTEMIREIAQSEEPVIGQPGEMFNYSNEGYALLQKIIERASGMSFLTYMDQYVLKPLNMDRSTFLQSDLNNMKNVTELYAYSKDKACQFFHSPVWWDVGKIYTNGSLKASAADMMKYLEMYINQGEVSGRQIISSKSIKQMTYPHVLTPNGIQYGYGLTIGREDGVDFYGHGGGIKGVSSFIAVAPKEGLTICVLINIAKANAQDLALTTMRSLLALEAGKQDEKLFVSHKPLQEYVGTYRSAEGEEVLITQEQQRLVMYVNQQDISLQPIGHHLFQTREGKHIAFIKKHHKIVAIFKGLRYLQKIS